MEAPFQGEWGGWGEAICHHRSKIKLLSAFNNVKTKPSEMSPKLSAFERSEPSLITGQTLEERQSVIRLTNQFFGNVPLERSLNKTVLKSRNAALQDYSNRLIIASFAAHLDVR